MSLTGKWMIFLKSLFMPGIRHGLSVAGVSASHSYTTIEMDFLNILMVILIFIV